MDELGGKLAMGVFLQDGDFKRQIAEDVNAMRKLEATAQEAGNLLDRSFDQSVGSVKNLSHVVVSESKTMSNAISQIGAAFTSLLSIGAVTQFVKQMFTVRSEMENTEAMLKVFTGSAEKASEFMEKLQKAAYYNVFEFKDLAEQSAQLLAYGNAVDTVIPIIDKLSNIAAGVNQPLERFVSIWNKVKVNDSLDYQTIMSLGSAGVNVKQVLADIENVKREAEGLPKILAKDVDTTGLKFKDLEAIINHVTQEGGMFYGMMEEKMKTLGDSYGLLQDNITNMFNEIGESSRGFLKTGMDGINWMLENYKTLATYLKDLVIIYGGVKAANIAYNLAMKQGTGIAVLDNTVNAIRASLLKKQISGWGEGATILKKQNKEQEARIALLKSQLTEEQNLEILNRARKQSIDQILTQQQKQRLLQAGLVEGSDEYLKAATAIMDKQQQQSLLDSELTNNKQSYIDALEAEINAQKMAIETIDERFEAAKKEFEIADEQFDLASQEEALAKKKVEIKEDLYKQSLSNADATESEKLAEELKTAQQELAVATEAADSAEQARNTAVKNLNTVATERQTIAEKTDTKATQGNTVAKTLWAKETNGVTKSFKALKAAIASNPLGAIMVALSAVIALFSKLKSAVDESNEGLNKMSEGASKPIAKLEELSKKWQSLKSIAEQNQFIKDNQEAFHELGLEIYDVATAQKLLIDKKDELIDYFTDVAVAKAYSEMNEEKAQKLAEKRLRIRDKEQQLEKVEAENAKKTASQRTMTAVAEGFNQPVVTLKGVSGGENGRAIQLRAEIEELKQDEAVIKAQMKKDLDAMMDTEKKAQEKIDAINQSVEVDKPTNAERIKAIDKEIEENNKKLKKIRESNEKADLAEIDRLEESNKKLEAERTKLTGNARKNVTKQADERKKAELELEIARQEAIIALMEDGAEKQQAILDLELAKQLKSINDAKEEAKKKGVDLSEGSEADKSFKAQIEAAEKAHEEASLKVYDHEIEERKQMYEDYLLWKQYVGEEAAEREFKQRIGTEKSFYDWVEKEIERLESKGNLTSGEDLYLHNLKANRGTTDENLQSYRTIEDELNRQLDLIDTVEGKIEATKLKIKNLLANGDKDPEKMALIVKLQGQIDNWEKQMKADQIALYQNLLSEYGNFVDRKKALEKDFNKKIAAAQAENNTEMVTALKLELDAAVANLAQELKERTEEAVRKLIKGKLWKEFQGRGGKQAIKNAIGSIADIDKDDATDEALAKFGITRKAWEENREAIHEARIELEELYDNKYLPDFIVKLKSVARNFEKIKVVGKDGKETWEFRDAKAGVQGLIDIANMASQSFHNLASSIGEIAEMSGNEDLKHVADNLEKAATVVDEISTGANFGASVGGGWGALVGGVVGAMSGLFKMSLQEDMEAQQRSQESLEKSKEAIEEVMQAIYDTISSLDSLESAITGLDYANISKSLLEKLGQMKLQNLKLDEQYDYANIWRTSFENISNSELLRQAGLRGISTENYENALRRYNDFQNNVQKRKDINGFEYLEYNGQQMSEEEYERKLRLYRQQVDIELNRIRTGVSQQIEDIMGELQARDLELQQRIADIQANPENYSTLDIFNTLQEYRKNQIAKLNAMLADADFLGLTDEQKIEIKNQLAELELSYKEAAVGMFEAFAGTDIAGIVNEWISIFDEFGTSGQLAFNKIDQSIDKMISNMIRQQAFIKPLTDKIKAMIEEAAGDDGILQDNELPGMFEGLRGLKGIARDLYENTMELERQAGLDLNNTSGNSFSSAVKGVSEETASIIAGQMNAIRVHQIEIQELLQNNIGENVAVIARNSAYLPQIYDRLGRVETAVNNSYSQRI